ncbi:glycine betaine ABC transporter substrate-binding protein [Methanospirillum sp.]
MKKILFLCLLILCTIALTLMVEGATATPIPPIKIHTGDWDSIKLTNAIAKYILEFGYGYEIRIHPTPEKTLSDDLSSGEVDVSFEVWKENHPATLERKINTGEIIDLGSIYSHASQYFIIPKWVAESHNISRLEQMKDYWYFFKDPENHHMGLFYPGLISWFVHDTNIEKLKAYGLTPFFNSITMPSGRSYEASFMKAAMNNQTIFGHYWSPSTVMGLDYWTILKEPELFEECSYNASSLNETSLLLCPFKNARVHKLVHPGLIGSAPDIISFIEKFSPGTKEISEILAYGYLHSIDDYDNLAQLYLKKYPDKWKNWIPSDKIEKISTSLNQNGEMVSK